MQSRRRERLTAEVALVLACCRWPPSPARDAAIRATAMQVDWGKVVALARRHRVQGLVHQALTTAGTVVPAAEGAAIAADALRIAATNLRLAAESLRLVRRLAEADVPAMVVKGTPLAMLAYGTLATKMAWDIDLLVPADGLDRAADALAAAGYACTLPGADRALLVPWHRWSKESVWRHETSGVHVELHTALADSPTVLPDLDARGPAEMVAISPGIVLPTLPRDALFAYLCVHGAASGWRRAKWLADIGALIGASMPEEVAALHAGAVARGVGRAAGVALLLCHRFLAMPVPERLLPEVRRDRAARLMAWAAGRMLAAPEAFDDPSETAVGTAPIHLMQLAILPGWRFPLAELRRKLAPDPRLGSAGAGRWVYPLRAFVRRVRRRDTVA